MTADFHLGHRRELLRGHVFSVEQREVVGPSSTFSRDVVVHPGAVAVVPIRADGRVGMLRQYRATFDKVTWELPAGTCDVPGELAEATAARELAEEVGCRATQISELFRYMNSRGWTDQVTVVFEATGLTFTDRRPHGPEEVAAEVHWLNAEQLREIRKSSEPVESSTLLVLLELERRWR